MGIITLISDFGAYYPAVMKAVILGITSDATIIDVSHEITSQNVREAAFILRETVKYFPRGTVHIAVVDPTVGTDRWGLVVAAAGHYLVGPDNGILIPAARSLGDFEVFRIEMNAESSTFHGRDVFAPVGAYLLIGRMQSLVPAPTYVDLLFDEPRSSDEAILGTILYVDRFGNCVTNIPVTLMMQHSDFGSIHHINGHIAIQFVQTYDDVARGQPLLTIGSFDLIEIAVNKGSATKELNLNLSDQISLENA
ncbi:MAG: SAM hydrolase/SAM-dependent halogenase family protein [Halobacteriota archaeon]